VADTVTRALASAWLNAGLTTPLNPRTPFVQLSDAAYPGRFSVAQRVAPLMAMIASKWTPVVGVLGLLAVLLRVFARSRREAIWLGSVFLLLLSLPGMQFALRHLFHLEALFWLGVLALPMLWIERRMVAPRALAFGALLLGVMATGATVNATLGVVQQHLLRVRIGEILAAPRQHIALAEAMTGNGSLLLGVA